MYNHELENYIYFDEIKNDILKLNLLKDIKDTCPSPLLELIETSSIKINILYFNSFTNEFKVILESNKIRNSHIVNYLENNINSILTNCLHKYISFEI